ncbi:MAG: hypothetical protein KBD01_19550 [Acidobacteria bacterium]|nr:hypothetical protein [Acidobacteriota bacterium]
MHGRAAAIVLLAAATLAGAAVPQPVVVPGTHVRLVPPEGFVAARQFPGFERTKDGASIMVAELATPVVEFRASLASDAAAQGMTPGESAPVRIAGRDGLLVALTQKGRATTYHKWMAVFGDERTTVVVTATYPELLAPKLEAPLKQAVLSARWDPARAVDRFEGLPFRVQETAQLKIAGRISNSVFLTRGGEPEPPGPGEPRMIVGPAVGQGRVEDLAAFSRARITQTSSVTGITIDRGKFVSIAGQKAYEIVAHGTERESGTPLVLYQLIVPQERGYYVAQASAAASAEQTYIPEFRLVSESLAFLPAR